MRRIVLALLAVSLLISASPAMGDVEGAGTLIGAPVLSTLSLDLDQTGATVRTVVTTTEPGALLSVAPADGRSGVSAELSGPWAPLDPAFGLPLVAWGDVLAGQATTLRLKSTSPSTVFITLSAATP